MILFVVPSLILYNRIIGLALPYPVQEKKLGNLHNTERNRNDWYRHLALDNNSGTKLNCRPVVKFCGLKELKLM